MEAIAGEVALLRGAFPRSAQWGVTRDRVLQPSWRKGIAFNPRLYPLFHAFTSVAQHAFHLNHLMGSLGDWHHLRSVSKRPVILTVALRQPPCDFTLLRKVQRFVVEWPGARTFLMRHGVNRQDIELVYPPVDLGHFVPSTKPKGPFTVLFASSPARADWFDGRGVPIVLAAARLCPRMRFVMCWRPWGDGLTHLHGLLRRSSLPNVEVHVGRVTDMSEFYSRAHVAVFCGTDPSQCKPVPNSITEAMACGCPVVVTPVVQIAAMVAEAEAGLVVAPDGLALAGALEELASSWTGPAGRARAVAEKYFDQRRFLGAYSRIYQEALGGATSGAGREA